VQILKQLHIQNKRIDAYCLFHYILQVKVAGVAEVIPCVQFGARNPAVPANFLRNSVLPLLQINMIRLIQKDLAAGIK